MLKKRKNSVIAFIVVTVLCLNSVFTLWTVNEETVLASDATRVEDVTFEMKTGASVRYATTAAESGLRFAATMPKADYEALQASGYAELSFGILIMPYNYIDYYGALTVENVFGDSAIYDWATLDENGKWVYSGSKTRIINLVSDNMTVDKDNADLYVVNGSITAIMENNLARDYVGVGYIQYKESANSEYSYRFAEYTDNNARSIVEVSEAVYADSAVADENKALVKEYYIDATDVRCVKFFDGDDILEIHKSFTEYYFDGAPMAEAESGHKFSHWVDAKGDTVEIIADITEVTKTMKLYAVYQTTDGLDYVAEGYLGANGKIMTTINEFLALEVTAANVASAQAKYEEVIDMLSVPRASEYNELVTSETRVAINAKVAEINGVLEESDDLYESYSGKLCDARTHTYTYSNQNNNKLVLPAINYSLLSEVTFTWSAPDLWTAFGVSSSMNFVKGNSALGGTVSIVNNGGNSLTVTMVETVVGYGTHTREITDENIINGSDGLDFYVKVNSSWTEAQQRVEFGEITATSLYDFTAIGDSVVLYTGQDLIDHTSTTNANKGTSDLLDGGVKFDSSTLGVEARTISLPCINYSIYETVTMAFSTNANNQRIGFSSSNYIYDGYQGNMAGTITITNNGDGTLSALLKDETLSKQTQATITDESIISGNAALTLYWHNGTNYRQLHFGPISATTSINGRLEVAAEAEKTPKLVESTLYTGQDLIDNTSVTNASGGVPLSESASSLITGGVNYDCSGTSATDWTVTLPKIAYTSYNTVTMSFQATNNWQRFGFVDGNKIADNGGSAMKGTITFTNNGGTVTVVINDTANNKNASYTITDASVLGGTTAFTLFWNQGAAYRQMSFGPITATAKVSADSVDAISVADREVALKLPYYNISGKTLYAGESLINSVSVTPSMTVNSYNDFFPNAVQFDPSGTKVTATISLPEINYASCQKVTMDFKGRNAWQTFGFSSTACIRDSGVDANAFNGTITVVTNADGTLTGTIIDSVTGNSATETITDTNIINGTSPLTLYWDSGYGYRQILIGPISCDTTGRVTTSPRDWYTLLDFNKSTYEVNAADLTDASREILVRRDLDDSTKLYIESQNSASTDTKTYAVELPWIAYNKYRSVKTTITSNNGYAGLTSDSAFHSTSSSLELEMEYADECLTITLGSSVSECTDADVLNGRKGLTIYVQGSQYTQTYLSEFAAMGKTTPVSSGAQGQALNMAVKSGSTEVAEYRIAYDANGAYDDSNYYKWVAEEMKFFLEEMTGTTFHLVGVHDASAISNSSKYIVIGEKLAKAMGVETFDLTQTNGYNVKQDYKNLYIYGASPRGTMNGVYGFLEDIAGLVSYTDEVYTYDYKGLAIKSGYATAFNPSFNMGITGYAEAQYTKEYYARLGLSNDGYIGTGTTTSATGVTPIGTHCMMDILPYDTYGSMHPEWYTDDATRQINFTSSNTTIDEMRVIVVESMKEAITAFPAHTYFVFGQPDSSSYAPDMAGYLSFMNRCSEEIDAWLQKEDPTRMVSLCMFAYTAGIEAPTSGSFYNGTCAETAVIFAPVGGRYTELLSSKSSYHKNSTTQEWTKKAISTLLEEWAALEGANIHFWLYGTDYYSYMMPMNTITNMQANYQYANSFGTDAIHFQLQTYTADNVGSDWQRLKTYLSAELTKDVNADVEEMQNNFMEAMYGAGASHMESLLQAQQEYVTYDNFNGKDPFLYPNNTEHFFGMINGSGKFFDTGYLNATYFDKDELIDWMGYIESAKAAVKADTSISDAEKTVLLNNIDVEALSIRYMLITLHGNKTYDESISAWNTAAKAFGCIALSESDEID